MGISPDEVLAVGDAPNDIPMFQLVGHSVAVGGCFDSLAAVAKIISPYPHGDTFAPLVDANPKQCQCLIGAGGRI